MAGMASYARQIIRARPALELLGRVPAPSTSSAVVDLGCGDGLIVPHLRRKWHNARIICVDKCRDALDKAMENCIDSNVTFVRADARTWAPNDPAGVVFANETLHSIDNHPALIPHLFSQLTPGGVLAFQMPVDAGVPFFEMAREGMLSMGCTPPEQHGGRQRAGTYYQLLKEASMVDIWSQSYFHRLDGAEGVAASARAVLEAGGGLWDSYAQQLPGGAEGEAAGKLLDSVIERVGPQGLLETQHLFVVARKHGHGPTEGQTYG
eukprot:TRINITY_DN11304_c0_g4_i1.p3 TRINITY_DN11304_c0_g4~~TRINITY_DN11304_c0_g4_i1.p3  ORF type:complete len:265 (+),score=81.27 TRINITY_DN11304_c0_g4_i1:58-852(+)